MGFSIKLPPGIPKACFYMKISPQKRSKYLSLLRFKPNVWKTAYTEKKAHWLLIFSNFFFFFLTNPKFKKVSSPKHVCFRKNHQFFFIKTHWSYFSKNDWLHRLNVYKIPRKDYQVLDFWVTNQLALMK